MSHHTSVSFFNTLVADLNDASPLNNVRVGAGGVYMGHETDW